VHCSICVVEQERPRSWYLLQHICASPKIALCFAAGPSKVFVMCGVCRHCSCRGCCQRAPTAELGQAETVRTGPQLLHVRTHICLHKSCLVQDYTLQDPTVHYVNPGIATWSCSIPGMLLVGTYATHSMHSIQLMSHPRFCMVPFGFVMQYALCALQATCSVLKVKLPFDLQCAFAALQAAPAYQLRIRGFV
jgi:hypothetical protein